MLQIENTTNIYQLEDPWGLSILTEFNKCGGFSKPENLRRTHAQFTDLFNSHHESNGPWSLRCRALAVWAYICLELELDQTDLESPVIAIAAALELLPGSEHHDWLIQLGFDLLQYKYAGESDAKNLEWVEDALTNTCSLAWWNFEKTRFNGHPGATHFNNTINLLTRLATNEKSAAASLILFNLVGQSRGPSNVENWLNAVCDDKIPIKQMATFYLGCWRNYNNPGSGSAELELLSFPADDDPQFSILASVASRAEAERYSIQSAIVPAVKIRASLSHDDNSGRHHAINSDIYNQFRALSRSIIRLSNLLEEENANEASINFSNTSRLGWCETEDYARYLSLESGRLIEATLKQGLISWFSDSSNLGGGKPAGQDKWSPQEYCEFIGEIFGCGENLLNIDQLFEKSKIKVPRDNFFRITPIKGRSGKNWILSLKTNLFSLLIANLLAAKCNDNHPFRSFSADELVEFLRSFSAAYNDRNFSAHFSTSNNLKPEETLRKAKDVQSFAARFLNHVK